MAVTLNLTDVVKNLTGPAQAILRPIYPGAKHKIFDLCLESHGQPMHSRAICVPRDDFPKKKPVARLHLLGRTLKIHGDGTVTEAPEPEFFSEASCRRALAAALEPLNLGGELKLFQGDMPTRTVSPTTGAVLLASLELGERGTKPFVLEGTTAVFRDIKPAKVRASGDAGFYRISALASHETVIQGTCSLPEEGGTLEFAELSLEEGGLVGIDRFSVSYADCGI